MPPPSFKPNETFTERQNMKIFNKIKWLVVALFAVALVLPVSAQNFPWSVHKTVRLNDSGSFFGETVKSLVVSNLISITNYGIAGVLGGTNVTGVTYTNKNNTRVVTSATVGTNTALLRTVPLWGRSDGSPAFSQYGSTNLWAIANAAVGDCNISITVDSSAGADTAATLIFAPVWDGINVDNTGSFDFTWSTGNLTASSTLTMHTNLPMARWIGARGLACKSVTYADTTAGATIAIRALSLNGFGPP